MPPRSFWIGLLVICLPGYANAGARLLLPVESKGAAQAAPAESRSGTILVFPFENNSRIASLDWLGEGLAELTVERLEDRRFNVLSRQERLAALEKVGLPSSAQFSHATMVKIAAEADADEVVFGDFVSDGKTVTFEARVLHISPAWLSPIYTQTSLLEEMVRAHAHLSGQLVCALERRDCSEDEANRDESGLASLPRLDALENFVRGILATDDEPRLRALREAARLEPAWERPPFELAQVYFARRDCESALPWFSRVPPNRPDGPEASFNTGVCHLLQNDAARADAAFSGLIERSRSTEPGEGLPEFPEARNNLGVARLRLGNWSEASAEFERAAALDAEGPDYWVNLGIAKLAAKQPAAALAPLERATNLDPSDKGARLLLIAALESLGRDAEAAAIRSETADSGGGRVVSAVPQDSTALARLARVAMGFDRSLLRSAGEGLGREDREDHRGDQQ